MDRVSLGLGAAGLVLVGSVAGAWYVGMSPDKGGGGGSGTTTDCDPVSAERAQKAVPKFVDAYMGQGDRPGVLGASVTEIEGGVGLLANVPDGSALIDTVKCFRGVPVRYMTSKGLAG